VSGTGAAEVADMADAADAAGAVSAASAASVSLADVVAARAAIAGQIVTTPCLHSRTLSSITGAEVWLKFENHQFTASFKERGALTRLLALTPEERARGVIAASAGNHAQGVAHHAARLGIPAVIVMPRFTPGIKVEMTERLGATVDLHGEVFDEARAHAEALAQERGYVFVHPFDDARIVAGQGTVGLEMLEACPSLEVLVAPVGGGGLLGGMAVAAQGCGVELVGVQAERFPSMRAALDGAAAECGALTIAEGIAVREPGRLTAALLRRHGAQVLLVGEDHLEAAILMLLEIEKTVVEGAGAAGLAALLAHPARFAGRRVGIVLSGGNLDPLVLAGIIGRGMARSGRLCRLSVALTDRPGALARITAVIAEAGGNIEEVRHERVFGDVPLTSAEVEFVVRTRGAEHVARLVAALGAAGFAARAPMPAAPA
jgi:threonine dehydratase